MADFEALLERTSRTFALSIPRLPAPTRREVTLAYLLFRVADTLEDASHWPRDRRLDALDAFFQLLESLDPTAVRGLTGQWLDGPPCDHDGYLDLIRALPELVAEVARLDPAPRDEILRHTRRTTAAMAGFVRRSDPEGRLRLNSLVELREYCYAVAGIVGEMLTALFLLHLRPSSGAAERLFADSVRFGEGLQLVNILKDSVSDERQGRIYLPDSLPRDDVFELARRDLESAERYVATLRRAGAVPGIIAFAALPILLAKATLNRVEVAGPGAKLTRGEVAAILRQSEHEFGDGISLTGGIPPGYNHLHAIRTT